MKENIYGYTLIYYEFNKAQCLRQPHDAGKAESNKQRRVDQVPDDIFIIAIHCG